jgi:hypothetical protein
VFFFKKKGIKKPKEKKYILKIYIYISFPTRGFSLKFFDIQKICEIFPARILETLVSFYTLEKLTK